MDRSTTLSANPPLGGNSNAPSSASLKLDGAAQAAHQTVEKFADKAAAGVDQLSSTAHRAVDGAADAANTAAQWVSTLPEQARGAQSRLAESACASIRARPLSTVAGAVVVGYLIGRLARF